MALKNLLHPPVEPIHPAVGADVFYRFAQGILVTRGPARIVVFVVKTPTFQNYFLGLSI
jgi:hypothetical protein